MKISLIGMSGTGKSYWSAKLAEYGFKRFCCDDLIAAKLAPELMAGPGPVLEVGEWMGFPYEAHYQERAAKYLACEIEVLTEICDYLEQATEPVVVDTTGSAIYAGDTLLERLSRHSLVVHLATPLAVQAQMLEAYVRNQRPVLWNGIFHKAPDETDQAALIRCYPALLASREALYACYAGVTVDYHLRRQADFSIADFLRLVAGEGAPPKIDRGPETEDPRQTLPWPAEGGITTVPRLRSA